MRWLGPLFIVRLAEPIAWDGRKTPQHVRRIFSLFYAKIMVVGDGQFYRGFGGYWVFWLVCSCQFGTDLALVE